MKKHTNKYLEEFVDKAMKSSALETPSFDFTSKVMSQVTTAQKSTVTVYKPLISKTAWGILLLLTSGLIIYSIFSKDTITLSWLNKLDFSKVSNLFTGVKISNTVMYALLIFAVMLFIQVPMLKHYYDQRFKL